MNGPAASSSKVVARYLVRDRAERIEDRALKIAVEQSVEMPLAGVRDPAILSDIVGKVRAIEARGDGAFEVAIELCARTIGEDADQLLNMLFGNTSMHEDVSLIDAELPAGLLAAFKGPNRGLEGLRRLVGAQGRAMTCAALKPQGLPVEALAELAHRFALGEVDFIKDDHGLANQSYSPFEARLRACARAVRDASRVTGRETRYIPSLWGSFEEIDRRLKLAEDEGVVAAMVAPALLGAANLVALARKHPNISFFAHPSFTGGARVAPPLYAKLFRLFGADAIIYANFGGRFGYGAETCRKIAEGARAPLGGLRPSAPVPAGGMTLKRAPELLDFYGRDAILLIGGDLLLAEPEDISAQTRAFVRAAETFAYP